MPRPFGSARLAAPLALLIALSLTGCKSVYYKTMETFGQEKRDLLVDRVEDARDSQERAKEQFRDALEQFQSVVAVEGGELEDRYNDLSSAFDDSRERAEAVSARIDDVRRVADDLFNEWEEELDEYKSSDLRRRSETQLRQTRDRYGELMDRMEQAEATMEPVLEVFEDHVLFLKHNLNARAIASLQGVSQELESDINRLIEDMERAINEADEFIQGMGGE